MGREKSGPQAAHETKLGTLFHGDCMEILPHVKPESIDLVFADPPFNLGKDYGKHHNDKIGDEQYLSWCEAWLEECVRVTKPGGAMYIWNLPKWNVELAHNLNELGMTFRHWIAVDIKYSLPIPNRLYPSHYSLLYYTKGRPQKFNHLRVPVPVCRHCGGDIKDYGGHRNKLNPQGLNLTDVWLDIPPVRHKNRKRRGANELSEKLLRRVLEISSSGGDLVLDPFGGSGTTFKVAEDMHRHWIGIELGDIEPIVRRLKNEPSDWKPPQRGQAGKGMTRSKPSAKRPTTASLWDSGDV